MTEVVRHFVPILSSAVAVSDVTAAGPDAPTVYLQAGLHANETTGPGVLHLLISRYEREPCPVRLRIVPHANPLGWRTYLETGNGRFSRPNGVNWNRIFAASMRTAGARPTAEQALAASLLSLTDGFRHVLDLHTPEFGWPHVYVPSLARRLRTFDDLPHVIDGDQGPTFAAHHARREDVSSSVTVELPSHRPQTLRDVEYWADRLHVELCALREDHHPTTEPVHGTEMIDLNATVDGICYPVSPPGEPSRAGSVVAAVIDPSGRRDDLVAPTDLIPLCYRRSVAVQAGGWAVRGIALAPHPPA